MGLFCLQHNIAPFPNGTDHCPLCEPNRPSYTAADLDRVREETFKATRDACAAIGEKYEGETYPAHARIRALTLSDVVAKKEPSNG